MVVCRANSTWGRPNSGVRMPELTSKEDLARWLAGKPRDVAAVFASRAALRAIPALAPALIPHGGQLRGNELRAVLGVFRCATAAWAVAAYPAHRDDLALAADSASAATVSPTASNVGRSGEYAAAAAANATTFTEFAVASINYAVEAIAIAGRQPFESLPTGIRGRCPSARPTSKPSGARNLATLARPDARLGV
jgi:microcystin-dependent protein